MTRGARAKQSMDWKVKGDGKGMLGCCSSLKAGSDQWSENTEQRKQGHMGGYHCHQSQGWHPDVRVVEDSPMLVGM